MKLISVAAQNFGSYKNLDFSFSGQNLTLISGPTGSGKSTLCDLVPWVLFGKTAKNGAADEIRSWGSQEATSVVLTTDLGTFTRIRGNKANDLYFEVNGEIKRGRDMPDTQKLINELLGMDLQTYLSGSYYHEFSQTAQFFTTTAKVRRSITEQIVDLGLATRLTTSLLDTKKQQSKQLLEITQEISSQNKILEYMNLQARELESKHNQFESDRARTILRLADEAQKLAGVLDEVERQIKNHPQEKCQECGSDDKQHIILIKSLHATENKLETILSQLEREETTKNPYTQSPDAVKQEKRLIALELAKISATIELADTELLVSVIEDFRTTQVSNAVRFLEENTNKLLEKHFDAELRVVFETEDKDKLEATITKDGNVCSYTQLSKGQRQILKLTFAVSVMKAVQQHNAISFNTLFLDECADGMDDATKIKAYGVLEELSLDYENVFAIDHSEAFKSCFVKRFVVESNNQGSQITNG